MDLSTHGGKIKFEFGRPSVALPRQPEFKFNFAAKRTQVYKADFLIIISLYIRQRYEKIMFYEQKIQMAVFSRVKTCILSYDFLHEKPLKSAIFSPYLIHFSYFHEKKDVQQNEIECSKILSDKLSVKNSGHSWNRGQIR